MAGKWRLVIHGGAGAMGVADMDSEKESSALAGLDEALTAGGAILGNGGNAIDAVEATARILEENPCFNAGRGSVLAHDGHIELDAALMDGATRRAGAVAGVRTT